MQTQTTPPLSLNNEYSRIGILSVHPDNSRTVRLARSPARCRLACKSKQIQIQVSRDACRSEITHQLSRFTQSYRISYTTEETIRERPIEMVREDFVIEKVFLPSAAVIFGYMKKADVAGFVAGKYFYCRATDSDGQPFTLDISAAQGSLLIGWTRPRGGALLHY